MEILFVIFLVLFSSFIVTKLLQKINLPKVLGPILTGILFTIFNFTFSSDINLTLSSLSEIGAMLILFYIGLELNLKNLKKDSKETFNLGISGFVITFLLSFLFSNFILELNLITSFVISAILSVTAEDIIVMILSDNSKLKTKIGEILTGAGILDDVIGIILLAIIPFLKMETFSVINIIKLGIGLLLIIIGSHFIKKLSVFIDDIFIVKKLKDNYNLFTYTILFLLFFAGIFHFFNLDFTIGALAAGMLLNFSLPQNKRQGILEEHKIDTFIKNITFGFLYYFFFFYIGYNVKINLILENWTLGVVLVIVAFIGKFLSGIYTAYKCKLKLKTGSILGIGMSIKGGMDIIIAEIARQNGLISNEIFSAIIFMSLTLTILSTILFKWKLNKK